MTQRTMNSLKPAVLALIVLAIGLTPIPGQAQASCGQITETALMAGQSIPVGSVVVENDAQYLYVTYQTDGNWLITETHLDIATRPEDLKQTSKGNAVPGQFAYKSEHDPGVPPGQPARRFSLPLTASWFPQPDRKPPGRRAWIFPGTIGPCIFHMTSSPAIPRRSSRESSI